MKDALMTKRRKVSDRAIVSIVAIAVALSLSPCNAETYSAGSGCLIESNRILTAYHVVDGASSISVSLEDGDWVKAKLVDGDKGIDWAVVETAVPLNGCLVTRANNIEIGDSIYTLGFPSASILGLGLKYADGVISSLTGLGGDVNRFQMTIPIQPGNSGGPVFNKSGALIGIVSSTVDPDKFYKITGGALPQNVNFAVPISRIPFSIRKGRGNDLYQNKQSTCFIKCLIEEKPVAIDERNTTKKAEPIKLPDARSKGKKSPDLSKTNIGVTDISSLFHFTMGDPTPVLLKYKTVSRDNTFLCEFLYKRPFLNFKNGIAEISKKSHSLVSLYAYTDEYDVLRGMKAFEDAEKAVKLIEEKFGIEMKRNEWGYDHVHPLGEPLVTRVKRIWRYTSWPNYYNSNSDYEKDPHHMIFVVVYTTFYDGYSKNSVWIELTGTSETSLSEKEAGAKEREAKKHQDALDAL